MRNWRSPRTFPAQPAGLVLLRHGESTANAAGRFAGWWDVELSPFGVAQAEAAADLLVAVDAVPDVLLTSPLRRAARTAELVADRTGCAARAVVTCPALTERAYGALTGRRKVEVSRVFGAELAQFWRRSLTGLPPAASAVDPDVWDPTDVLGSDARTAAEHRESLRDVMGRVRGWRDHALQPRLAAGQRVLVVAHGNSLRALIAVLDGLDADEVQVLNVPTGQPLRYDLDRGAVPVPRSGRYLDPEGAATATLALTREGGT